MSKKRKSRRGKLMHEITDIRPVRRGVKATGVKLDAVLSVKCEQQFKDKFERLAGSQFMTTSDLLMKLAADYVSEAERRFNYLSPVFGQSTENGSTASTEEYREIRA